jgi:serine phosphatase RsbU (regulator of sigma subunit)
VIGDIAGKGIAGALLMANLRLASNATVLGLFEDWDCVLEERQLFRGDTLVLYTDGMTESFNDSGEEFGEQRLIEALQRHRGEAHRPWFHHFSMKFFNSTLTDSKTTSRSLLPTVERA